jgi:hypothetical protein
MAANVAGTARNQNSGSIHKALMIDNINKDL